jgi:hypothetical protein
MQKMNFTHNDANRNRKESFWKIRVLWTVVDPQTIRQSRHY